MNRASTVLRAARTNLQATFGALLVLAAAVATTPSHAAPLKPGDAAPDLAAFGLEGKLPEWKGQVVLLDFFASWCGPCKDSFPVLQELHQKYGQKGLVIVAVNVDKKPEDMEKFLKKFDVSFAVVRDSANRLISEVKVPTMPSSFVIGRDGKIAAAHRGFKGEETRKKYVEEIEALLK